MAQTLVAWEDGWRIRLPLPFQLQWIYAYLLRGSEGYTIVDCGLNDEAAWETWQGVFAHLNIDPAEIRQIVLTHYHPDHYGLAGRLQRLTRAEVKMSAETERFAQLFWGSANEQQHQITALYSAHGLPRRLALELFANLKRFKQWVRPHPQHPRLLASGQTVTLGERTYDVWHTPGHAEGHLSFYDAERKWLIGGDVLLYKITPNISLYPHGDPNPLQTFLTTLHKLKKQRIRKVFPAHGPVFTDVQARIDEIITHHDERLQHIERLSNGTRTAFDLCRRLFGDQLSIHNLRFALAETLAHLEYLRQDGRLSLVQRDNLKYYKRV